MKQENKVSKQQEQVLTMLTVKRNKWVTGASLKNAGGYKEKASLRNTIRTLRLSGFPIIADIHKGYKLTTNRNEIVKYAKARKGEIMAELRVLIAMEGRIR